MFGNNSDDDDRSGIVVAHSSGKVWTFGDPSDEQIRQAKREAMKDAPATEYVKIGLAAVGAYYIGTRIGSWLSGSDSANDE